jgi:hypothetical protein
MRVRLGVWLRGLFLLLFSVWLDVALWHSFWVGRLQDLLYWVGGGWQV